LQYFSTPQATHTRLVVDVQATVWYWLSWQGSAHVDIWVPPKQKLLAGQLLHTRLVVLVQGVVS